MAGIYIHIPFCKQKCTYCDFHFSTTYAEYKDEMIASILAEIVARKDYLEGKSIQTIYFGGGTPSLLNSIELASIIEIIKLHFQVKSNVEITLEANPDDVTIENLTIWKDNGVNRLSIGLQSFKKTDLKWMNRAHSADESLNSIILAQKNGFSNITVDLMYGLPGLTNEEWKSHIQTIIELKVPHISAYNLTVEKGTVLNNWVEKKKIVPANEDQQSEQFSILIETIEQNGYYQYEISNFCQHNFESKHNSNYWKGEWYMGVGPSAHSFNGESRQWNISNNQMYLRNLSTGGYFELEILSPENQFNELILTGLRTIYGVNIQLLNKIISPSAIFTEKVNAFIAKKWMIKSGEVLTLTKEGRLLADFIASELFYEKG